MADWTEVDVNDAPAWVTKWQRYDFEPIPDWLREVFDAVLPDMQTSRPLTLQFAYEHKRDEQGTFYAWVAGDDEEGVSGTSLDWWDSPVERLVEFADWLQDQVIPESRSAWGEACPPCRHTHPAKPDAIDTEAWWTCPRDGSKLARIGQLG
jgi:ssDNA-binding Zn-finger/Zn-ribbon topoisomerase 1